MRCEALRRLGFDMTSIDSGSIWTTVSYGRRHIDQRLRGSGTVRRFNEKIEEAVRREKPSFLWADKQEYLTASLLEQIRSSGTVTIHYNPDPYYSLGYKQTLHTDAALASYDVLVVTKRYELDEYSRRNTAKLIYSPLGFDVVGHRRATTVLPEYRSDMSFIGGWEPRRESLILAASAPDRSIKVWGYGWRMAQQSRMNPLRALRLGRSTNSQRPYFGSRRSELSAMVQDTAEFLGEIYEDAYSAAVAGSSISLGFLREICPDQHTTRSFEIPAMGGFLLADRSDEHREFFEEGKEAEFFHGEDEFLEKIRFYLAHDSARRKIAEAGYQRCFSSGYSYDDRLRTVLTEIGFTPSRTPTERYLAATP